MLFSNAKHACYHAYTNLLAVMTDPLTVRMWTLAFKPALEYGCAYTKMHKLHQHAIIILVIRVLRGTWYKGKKLVQRHLARCFGCDLRHFTAVLCH